MHYQEAQQNDGVKVITVECDKALITTGAVMVKAFIVGADC